VPFTDTHRDPAAALQYGHATNVGDDCAASRRAASRSDRAASNCLRNSRFARHA